MPPARPKVSILSLCGAVPSCLAGSGFAAYNPIVERYRIHPDAALYYLTYSVVEWLPVFVSQASCQIVTESLSFCHRKKQLRVNA